MKKINVFILATLFLVTGCNNSTAVATIDGEVVTQEEVNEFMKYKGNLNASDSKKNRILKSYIERKALAEAISKEDLLDGEQIKVELEEFRKQMLLSRYFDKFLAGKVSEKAIENFYSINTDQFQSRKVKVAHILFRLRKGMSENEQLAKLTEAHALYSKLKAGESFEDLVVKFSEDKNSSAKGGSLGWLKEGAIDPVFSKAAFELSEGAYSEPVRTPFGFHIIKSIEAPTVITQSLEKVKGDIRYQLRNKAKSAELIRLKNQVEVEYK